MTVFVLLFVSAGVLVGLFGGGAISGLDTAIVVLLVVLVFGVGLDLGVRGDAISRVRSLGFQAISIPVISCVGSLTGVGLVASAVWGHPLRDAFALGSAFGWYSLSGPLLTHLGGPELGALGFLSDVLRELLAFLLIPVVAGRIGFAEAVALGGATSMDTTLPLIARMTDGEAAPLAFAHGMVVGLIAPVLIPFWFRF
ncbi:MAG TPA: lysine exporter LysO family protein [Candidatus Latescibacteria bacterium]|nr:lysine exporter LysO family protein [Candidatus Latescibacterota bacterium]